ncbi:coagulation factor XIII B chain-like isoform X3 [Pelodiscus sinensis]|uniref:coagulation factor XIII B chain-like isoform X3 n=1 Tax=Pelodiscus sinensis TaxID=13735 RepID=UPI003F6D6326
MIFLSCLIIQLLWAFCVKGQGRNCSRPPILENGDITTFLEKEYTSGSFVEFKCQKFYAMEGQNRSFCDNGKWTKAPVCLEPCTISVEEMENHTIVLNERANENTLQGVFLKRGDSLEFRCKPGYVLVTTSSESTFTVQCNENPIIYPECRETGRTCSRPPIIENGDITTFLEKQYTSGSFVEFKCQKFYAMEGQNISFCDNGKWTKAPICLEPCVISVKEMENHTVELNERANENIPQWVYLKRGDFLELRCQSGYSLATNSSESTFMVQCNENPIVYPECREIVCDLPGVVNGRFRPQRNMYRDGDVIIIICNHGFHSHVGCNIAECTKNGWIPPPRCSST